jgi:hypothetical protein
MNATLNQKKSLQTVPTTVPRRPQIPLALGPSHQSSWNHCTPSLLPTHPRSNQLKTDHHRPPPSPGLPCTLHSNGCSITLVQSCKPISCYLSKHAASRVSPREQHSVETKARLGRLRDAPRHLPNRAETPTHGKTRRSSSSLRLKRNQHNRLETSLRRLSFCRGLICPALTLAKPGNACSSAPRAIGDTEMVQMQT